MPFRSSQARGTVVGCGAGAALERFNRTNEIVAVNLKPLETEWLASSNVTVETADATRLPYDEGEFRRRVRMALNRRFSLGWQPKGEWEEITLLTVCDLRRLFPDAEIHRERLFGLTKSLMAVRR